MAINSLSSLETAVPKGKRVTLTTTQAATTTGRGLVQFLTTAAADGQISPNEVENLRSWLQQPDVSELPAVVYLREIVGSVLADGKIDLDETYELRRAIQRVLPKEEREIVSQQLSRIERPATERQTDYIRGLGGTVPPNLTLPEASALIEELLKIRPPTPRQAMVLRFWNRLDLHAAGKDAVSAWMDQWYAEDPDRLEAWELYKRDSRDDGSQRHAERVPVGAGAKYLKRVKNQGTSFLIGLVLGSVILFALVALGFFLAKTAQ